MHTKHIGNKSIFCSLGRKILFTCLLLASVFIFSPLATSAATLTESTVTIKIHKSHYNDATNDWKDAISGINVKIYKTSGSQDLSYTSMTTRTTVGDYYVISKDISRCSSPAVDQSGWSISFNKYLNDFYHTDSQSLCGNPVFTLPSGTNTIVRSGGTTCSKVCPVTPTTPTAPSAPTPQGDPVVKVYNGEVTDVQGNVITVSVNKGGEADGEYEVTPTSGTFKVGDDVYFSLNLTPDPHAVLANTVKHGSSPKAENVDNTANLTKTDFLLFPGSCTNDNAVSCWSQKIFNWAQTALLLLATAVTVLAGVIYMTSAGNEKQIATAKKMILGALSGVAVIILGKFFLVSIIGVPWG